MNANEAHFPSRLLCSREARSETGYISERLECHAFAVNHTCDQLYSGAASQHRRHHIGILNSRKPSESIMLEIICAVARESEK